jgi:hypothetical protein
MDGPKLPRLAVLPRLGKRSWLVLPPVCGLLPKGFVDASGVTTPGPNSCRSAGGGGNVGGGDGENDDLAGVTKFEPVPERGIREPVMKDEVSRGVMAKSLGILTTELLALRRFTGPEWNDGEAGRERCGGPRAGWSCSTGSDDIVTELDEPRLAAACRSRLGDDSADGPDPGAVCGGGGGSSRGLSIAAGTPEVGLGSGLRLVLWSSVIMMDSDRVWATGWPRWSVRVKMIWNPCFSAWWRQ